MRVVAAKHQTWIVKRPATKKFLYEYGQQAALSFYHLHAEKNLSDSKEIYRSYTYTKEASENAKLMV